MTSPTLVILKTIGPSENWGSSNIDPEFLKALDVCRRYVDHFDALRMRGIGLYLVGDYGVGKSWLCHRITEELGEWTAYWQAGDLLDELKNTFHNLQEHRRIESRFAGKRLVILDDLGSEYQTGWSTDELARLIDQRYQANKPIIVTANPGKRLEQYQGRMFDRIAERCITVDMSRCPNYRKTLKRDIVAAFDEITGRRNA